MYMINSPRNRIAVPTVSLLERRKQGVAGEGKKRENDDTSCTRRPETPHHLYRARSTDARADSYLSLANNLFSRDVSSRQIRRRVIITTRTLERIKEDPSWTES